MNIEPHKDAVVSNHPVHKRRYMKRMNTRVLKSEDAVVDIVNTNPIQSTSILTKLKLEKKMALIQELEKQAKSTSEKDKMKKEKKEKKGKKGKKGNAKRTIELALKASKRPIDKRTDSETPTNIKTKHDIGKRIKLDTMDTIPKESIPSSDSDADIPINLRVYKHKDLDMSKVDALNVEQQYMVNIYSQSVKRKNCRTALNTKGSSKRVSENVQTASRIIHAYEKEVLGRKLNVGETMDVKKLRRHYAGIFYTYGPMNPDVLDMFEDQNIVEWFTEKRAKEIIKPLTERQGTFSIRNFGWFITNTCKTNPVFVRDPHTGDVKDIHRDIYKLGLSMYGKSFFDSNRRGLEIIYVELDGKEYETTAGQILTFKIGRYYGIDKLVQDNIDVIVKERERAALLAKARKANERKMGKTPIRSALCEDRCRSRIIISSNPNKSFGDDGMDDILTDYLDDGIIVKKELVRWEKGEKSKVICKLREIEGKEVMDEDVEINVSSFNFGNDEDGDDGNLHHDGLTFEKSDDIDAEGFSGDSDSSDNSDDEMFAVI